jgi:16S rRNA (cytosine967-C5)-methyltransferase
VRLHREAVAWRLRLDSALAACCHRPLSSLDPRTLAALRLGAVQILVLGTPPHAAVNESVAVAGPRSRGLVNAVLRRLAAEGEPEPEGPWVAGSHPRDLWERWASRYGPEGAGRLMEWDNAVPPLGASTPPGYVEIERSGPLEPPPGAYIQDEASALVGAGAAALPGGTVVELCAAPGGKTFHLDPSCRFDACLDSSRERLRVWTANAERLGFRNSCAVLGDASQPPFVQVGKVVVDAPCTGTGVYRRHPDARWGWSGRLLSVCVDAQRRILSAAAGLTAPGGCLVYSVCSLEPEEAGEQAEWFERSFPGFGRRPFPAPSELVREGALCIFPPDHGIDGHFAVCWERTV